MSHSTINHHPRFPVLSLTVLWCVIALILAGMNLGGLLGRDAAQRDNRWDHAQQRSGADMLMQLTS